MVPVKTLGGEWQICDGPKCRRERLKLSASNELWLNAWLLAAKSDPLRMTKLRQLLLRYLLGRSLFQMSEDDVIREIRRLRAAGRLHLHEKAAQVYPLVQIGRSGGGSSKSSSAATPPAPRRAQQSSSSRDTSVYEPETFGAPIDGAAQAAALVAAAQQGQPFCPQ